VWRFSTRNVPGGWTSGEFAKRIGRAVGDELSVVDIGDMAAALGFVHVVSGDEEGDAMTGKLEEEIPELAGARPDRCPRWARRERGASASCSRAQPRARRCFQATGKLRGQAIEVGSEAIELDNFVDAALQARGLEACRCGRRTAGFSATVQIVIETEVLRHVADMLADGFGIRAGRRGLRQRRSRR